MERVTIVKYLGLHISSDLKWTTNTASIVKKAHQRLHFMRRVKQAGLSAAALTSFYRCVVENVLTSSITAWHGSCSAADKKALQRVENSAQKMTNNSLPSLEGIYISRCRTGVMSITTGPAHPAHELFTLLPSGRRLGSLRTRTTRLRCSFFPEAVSLMNS